MTPEEILQFKNLVKHEFVDCVAHDEGQYCCLDEEHQRHNQIIDFINNLLKSRQEKMIEEIKKETRYTISSMCCGEGCYMEETDSGEYVKIENILDIIKNNANINL